MSNDCITVQATIIVTHTDPDGSIAAARQRAEAGVKAERSGVLFGFVTTPQIKPIAELRVFSEPVNVDGKMAIEVSTRLICAGGTYAIREQLKAVPGAKFHCGVRFWTFPIESLDALLKVTGNNQVIIPRASAKVFGLGKIG